jgi:hypothetical protein
MTRRNTEELMQSTSWTPEHSQALREYLARGMSYSEIADAINAKFKTAYSRNATLGRARRMGLAGPERPEDSRKPLPQPWSKPARTTAPRLHKLRERHQAEFLRIMPIFEAEPVSSAASKSIRAICRWSNLRPAIAATLTAATRRARPSPSAAIRSARAQATARRIFT